MATIKDVAKMAGVSTTTVSHVINKTRFVAKETEEAVMQAIKSLKYSPSAVAQSLKVNTTKSDRKSTRLNSSHSRASRMPSSA